MLSNVFVSSVGFALIGLGLIVLPLPIPLGAVMIICGASLAISASARVRRWVRNYRGTHPSVEKLIDRFKPVLPAFIRRSVDDSDPKGPASP